MHISDFRLDGFFPALLIPPESAIPLSIAFTLLTISIFTQTVNWNAAIWLRLVLAPFSIYYFLFFAFWPYETVGVRVDVALAVVGLYGVMRVIETTFISFMDASPPHWVVGGKEVPLPTTLSGRLAYAIDLATSLVCVSPSTQTRPLTVGIRQRGNSWFSKTHWHFAPKALVNSPVCLMSRSRFLGTNIISLIPQYLIFDICDSIDKSRTWDRSNPYPITNLPWHEQLVFSISVCAQTCIGASHDSATSTSEI